MGDRLENVGSIVLTIVTIVVGLLVLAAPAFIAGRLAEAWGPRFYAATFGGGAAVLLIAYLLASEPIAAAGAILAILGALGFFVNEMI